MNAITRIAAVVSIVAAPIFACAQQEPPEEQEPQEQQQFSYATYFYCDIDEEDRASEIVQSTFAPVYQAAIDDGTITGWGWLAHHTGGKWRRIRYSTAPTLEALFDAQKSIGDALQGEEATDEFGSICESHDDYVWQVKAGSSGDDRGEVGFSVYFQCKIGQGDRVDELVETVFAPVYERHVGDGKLKSWGWLSHVIGGKYRRLAMMTAADVNTLLRERTSLIGEILEMPEADEFNEICGSHQDYIWNIEIESP